MTDLYEVWPTGEDFVPTTALVAMLIAHNPYWGAHSPFDKPLSETRLGGLINEATKATSTRPHTPGPRGYARSTLEPIWRRLRIGRPKPGEPGDEQETE